ncbi:hypothetical protein RHMOL_Rhmol12G0092800 [Rhododendron molle]|uniref:Uncharacterized protein n=1 Tax=Rhododendron molle TaxID=49168 RepID=A0ACC0LGC6_RHOML|nr:hypothetical protein RHMOL_Rhmol12G0092800 [Rhododendron molle]
MTQRNDPLMNQRLLEIEREARRLGSPYLRLRRLRRALSLVRNDRNSANAHVIPIGGQSVNIPLLISNEPNPTGFDFTIYADSKDRHLLFKWMFSVRANTIDLRNLIEEYLGIRSWQNRWRQQR